MDLIQQVDVLACLAMEFGFEALNAVTEALGIADLQIRETEHITEAG